VSTAIQEIRFRPLGRGTFIGGFFMTLAIHAGLFGLAWYGTHKGAVEERPREITITQFVRLGKPREKFYLPRIEQPPPPKPVEEVIKVTDNLDAKPTEKEKEKEKPKKDDLSKKVQDVLNRRRAMLQGADDTPPEGLATGSVNGTASTATVGDEYATQIHDAIYSHWSVPTGLSIGDAQNLETTVRVGMGPDGTITSATVVKPSGNSLYDDACVQAMQATHRLPPPPPALRSMYRHGFLMPCRGKELAR
jgi:TonB family protein